MVMSLSSSRPCREGSAVGISRHVGIEFCTVYGPYCVIRQLCSSFKVQTQRLTQGARAGLLDWLGK